MSARRGAGRRASQLSEGQRTLRSRKKARRGPSPRRISLGPGTRTCQACGKRTSSHRLLRLVGDLEAGGLQVDLRRRGGGRGAYVCFDRKCLEVLIRKRRLPRALRSPGLRVSLDEIVEGVRFQLVDKIRYYLALSQKSGRVVSGTSLVLKALGAKRVSLVLTASDLAENSRDRLEAGCRAAGLVLHALPLSREELGGALGRGSRAVVALPAGPLAQSLEQALENLDSIAVEHRVE